MALPSEKPDALPQWATGAGTNGPSGSLNVVEPNAGKKASGWNYGEVVVRNWWNWLQLKTYQWLLWAKEFAELGNGRSIDQNFGINWEESSGLDLAINLGTLVRGRVVGTIGTGFDTLTLPTSVTRYVAYQADTGTFTLLTNATDADAQWDTLLYRVVTNGTDITTVDDLRSFTATRSAIMDGTSSLYIEKDTGGTYSEIVFEHEDNNTLSAGFGINDATGIITLVTSANGTVNTVMSFDTAADTLQINDSVEVASGNTLTTKGKLQADAEFEANGLVDINLADNTTNAFNVSEGANTYINVTTLNGSETATFGASGFTCTLIGTEIDVGLNSANANALEIKDGVSTYLNINTSVSPSSMLWTNAIHDVSMVSGNAAAFTLRESTDNYIVCNTTTGNIHLGSAGAGNVVCDSPLLVGTASNGTVSQIGNINKLYAGTFRFDGATQISEDLPSGWSVARNAAGSYTLTHNLATTNYALTFGAHMTDDPFERTASYRSKASNTVIIDASIAENGSNNDDSGVSAQMVNAEVSFMLIVLG